MAKGLCDDIWSHPADRWRASWRLTKNMPEQQFIWSYWKNRISKILQTWMMQGVGMNAEYSNGRFFGAKS